MRIAQLSKSNSSELLSFYLRNTDHLKEWEPSRPTDFTDAESWGNRLISKEEEMRNGKAAYFIGIEDNSNKIICVCSLTNIVYGAFMATYMGYAVDKSFEGKGNMKKLCYHAIDHAFNTLQLHRIMANYMPRNTRSAKLLNRLNFTVEGKAKKYLRINGKWEDHILTSLTTNR